MTLNVLNKRNSFTRKVGSIVGLPVSFFPGIGHRFPEYFPNMADSLLIYCLLIYICIILYIITFILYILADSV